MQSCANQGGMRRAKLPWSRARSTLTDQLPVSVLQHPSQDLPGSSRPSGAGHRVILSSTISACPSTLGTKAQGNPSACPCPVETRSQVSFHYVLIEKMSLMLSKRGIHSADVSVRETNRPAKNVEQLSFPGSRGLAEGRGNGRSLF